MWTLNAAPKFQAFIWKLTHNQLPMAMELVKRGMQIDPSCKQYGGTAEDVVHLCWICPHSLATWEECEGELGIDIIDEVSKSSFWELMTQWEW